MTPSIALPQAPNWLASKAAGGRVFIPGGPIEPLALAQSFGQDRDQAGSLIFCGLMIPGINTTDWAAFHPHARAEAFLPTPDMATTIASGQTQILPLHYSAAYRYLRAMPFEVAVFHVCAPDKDGLCNLSLSADSSPAFLDRSVFKLGIINHGLPTILGAPRIAVSLFDAIVTIDQPPIFVAATPPSGDVSVIASRVAQLVENGATLQAGIGKLPGTIMAALQGHKDLKIHSGLIGDWVLDLSASGALSEEKHALTAGVILGSNRLHDMLRDDPRLTLVPISQTHGHTQLGAIERFTSLNAALEIDLFGQINCEYAGPRTIGGVGGAVDFLRGARASQGGKPIIMIQSLGKDGTSRIVPRLSTPTISITRSDAPIVVTEYGSVDLEHLDTQRRAQAIIALASPNHRDALARAWREARI